MNYYVALRKVEVSVTSSCLYYKIVIFPHQEKDPELRYAHTIFRNADKNGDGTLSFSEITSLLKQINLNLPSRYVRKLYDSIVAKGEGLSFEQLHDLMARLRRSPEIERLFQMIQQKKYEELRQVRKFEGTNESGMMINDEEKLGKEDVRIFLHKVQMEEDVSDQMVEDIIAQLELEEADGLRYRSFHRLLSSETNEVGSSKPLPKRLPED